MAGIQIRDLSLSPAGCDLFADSETFLHELGEAEVHGIQGGLTPAIIIGTAILLWPRNAY